MATFTLLPSKKWRVQVRRKGLYRAATFTLKRDAVAWSTEIDRQADFISANGYTPPPKSSTLGDLIDTYLTDHARASGRTKAATLAMLKREIGSTKLTQLNDLTIRDFVDRRVKAEPAVSPSLGTCHPCPPFSNRVAKLAAWTYGRNWLNSA